MQRWVVRFAVSVALVAFVIWLVDAQTLAERLRAADMHWLLVAGGALTLVTFLMALRWQITARSFGINIAFMRALAEYYQGQLINTLVPGGMIGDVGRAVRVKNEASLTAAAQSVAAERLIGQAFMLGVMAAGFALVIKFPGEIRWPIWSWGILYGGVILVALAVLLIRRGGATGLFLQRCSGLARQPSVAVLSLMICALLIFALYACARATGTILSAETWLTLLPLILTAMIIPVSIGGWGWREGAAAALFPIVDLSAEAGIASSITFGATIALAALPALFFILIQTKEMAPKAAQEPNS